MLKHTDSDRVVLKEDKVYTIKKKKDDLEIEFSVERDRLITKSGTLKLNSEQLSSDSTYFELIDFDAYSLVPENGKYKKKRVKEFFKGKEWKTAFTHDTQTMQFFFPSSQARTITHLEYRSKLNDEKIVPNTFLGFFSPAEQFSFKVIVDPEVDIEFFFFNVDNDTLNYEKKETSKAIEHTWTFKNVPKTKYFGGAPDIRWYLPHISFKIKGYQTSSGYKRVLTDLDDLYKVYQNWVSMIPEEDEAKLKKVVEEEGLKGATDFETLEKIYNWVQAGIKYISHTDGMEGFVPRSGTDVFTCRYGDCKGMSNLMHGLAKAAGVQTHRTWIGSRDIPYTYEEVSTPLVDNHMILSYVSEDTVIFLDATDSYLPFGMPTQFIQDKQALIGIDETTYKLETVPIPKAEDNTWTDTVWVKVDDNGISGTGKLFISGYFASRWRERIQSVDKKDLLEFASGYFEKGDNRFAITDIRLGSSDNTMESTLEYDFTIPNYITKSADNIFINLNLEKGYADGLIDDERAIPIELSHFSNMASVVNLEVPSSYLIDFVPEATSYNSDNYGYTIEYGKEANSINYSIKTYTKSLIMYPEEFEEWNKMSKQFRKDIRTNIVLKRKPDQK